jgi:hypothetical protein
MVSGGARSQQRSDWRAAEHWYLAVGHVSWCVGSAGGATAEQPWVWGSASRGSEGSANRVGISQPGSSQQRGKHQPGVHRGGYTSAQGSLMRTTAFSL